MENAPLLLEQTVDRLGSGCVAAAAIAEDGIAIEFKRPAPDVAAFETGAPHAGAHPLDDKVALQFCNCPR